MSPSSVIGDVLQWQHMSGVGQDIESICAKCGDVWHVIVAKVGTHIAKVQCKECGAYHRHRPVGGSTAKEVGTTIPRTASRAAKKSTAAAPVKIEANMQSPIRGYSTKEHYSPGERVDHPKFGMGVVEETEASGKMTVFFSGQRRILAMAKPASTLVPPADRFVAPAE